MGPREGPLSPMTTTEPKKKKACAKLLWDNYRPPYTHASDITRSRFMRAFSLAKSSHMVTRPHSKLQYTEVANRPGDSLSTRKSLAIPRNWPAQGLNPIDQNVIRVQVHNYSS